MYKRIIYCYNLVIPNKGKIAQAEIEIMQTVIPLDLLKGQLTNRPLYAIGEPFVDRDDFFETEAEDGFQESNLNILVGKSVELEHNGTPFELRHDFNVLVSFTHNLAENKLSWYVDEEHLEALTDHNVRLLGNNLSLLNDDGVEALYWNAFDDCHFVSEHLPLIVDQVNSEAINLDAVKQVIDAHIQSIGTQNITNAISP